MQKIVLQYSFSKLHFICWSYRLFCDTMNTTKGERDVYIIASISWYWYDY